MEERKPLFTCIVSNGRYSIDVCNYPYPATGVVKPYYIHQYSPRCGCWVFVKAYKSLPGAANYFNRLTALGFDYKAYRKAQG